MAVVQVSFGAESGAEVQTVRLDGVDYILRVRWCEPQQSWYADLYDTDENPLVVGRRLTPGYAPFTGHRAPPGFFIVDGPENPTQADLRLGGELRLLYVEANNG